MPTVRDKGPDRAWLLSMQLSSMPNAHTHSESSSVYQCRALEEHIVTPDKAQGSSSVRQASYIQVCVWYTCVLHYAHARLPSILKRVYFIHGTVAEL